MRLLAQFVGVMLAIAGAARYKTGGLLLAVYIGLNGKKSPEDLFAAGWRFIHMTRWFFRGREYGGNRYQIDWRNFACMRLLGCVKARHPAYVPEIAISNDAALMRQVAAKAPVVVVTVHTRFETVLNRVCEERGVEYCVIGKTRDVSSASQFILAASQLLGLKGSIDFIGRSDNAMLAARRKLKQGKVVITCVDFTRREPGTLYQDLFIAENLFVFAARHGARIVYARTGLSPDGKILVGFSDPGMPGEAATPGELVDRFIEFIANAGDRRQWKVRPWHGDAAPRAKQYSNFWIRRPV